MKSLLTKRAIWLLAVSVWLVGAVQAEEAEQVSEVDALRAELSAVRQEITIAQEEMQVRSKELWRQQHELEYGHPACTLLRQEIKDLEAQLIAKRKELDLLVKIDPEMKALDEKRKVLFQRVRELREEEQAIQTELAGAERRAGLSE